MSAVDRTIIPNALPLCFSKFYRHLCFALLTRTALIPVEVYATSNYLQLIAETFPEMTFASAWTLLVSFFVQLVGAASGAGTYERPGNILQAIAYGIYVILILTDLWNDHASVLLYAILCCIYAALLGTLLYFGPRLLAILQPSLSRRSGLGIRLIGCTLICMITFGLQSVNLARQVVAPPKERKLWWSYGSVELFPSIALLFMMHSNRSQRNKSSSGRASTSQSEIAGRRGGDSKQGETATLIKSGASYGTSSDSS